jgi:multidrug efflux pump subunit AcrA (membrane-fusion protein)
MLAAMHLRMGRRLGVAGVALCLGLGGCAEVEDASVEGYEPSSLSPVAGTDFNRVTFTEEGAARTGLETAPVRRSGGRLVVPYEALIYAGEGTSYVYSSPKPLTYQRTEVAIDRVRGSRVLLTDGPRAGSQVVTVGASEVYGAELEIAGGH